MLTFDIRGISPVQLIYAITSVLNVELAAFAIVLVLMAVRDWENRSFRWLALSHVAGFAGALFGLFGRVLPFWFVVPMVWVAPPVAFACYHAGFILFLNRGSRSRWVSLALVLVGLPFYVFWSFPNHPPHGHMGTLQDFLLAVQTALSAALLFTTRDPITRWPRYVLATLLTIYSMVECARVAVFFVTGKLPDAGYPPVEFASGIVYVIAVSLLPFAFIWMQNARLYAQMTMQMTSDPLTQLLNRRGLAAAANTEIVRYRRLRQEFAVAIMDVDHFKRFNDTFGHAAGDVILCEIASLLRTRARHSDALARFGGEEFVLLLPSTPPHGAMRLVEDIRLLLEGHVFHLSGQQQVHVHASFGITDSKGREDVTWETLLCEADTALYAAKRAGRNRACFYEPGHDGLGHEGLATSAHQGSLQDVSTASQNDAGSRA